MTFQIAGLPRTPFEPLFGLPDRTLADLGVLRLTAEKRPGARFPCRVSLRDADAGTPVLLLNFEHLPLPSPYRSRYAIYVGEAAPEARLEPGEIPEVMQNRPLAVRAFDGRGMLLAADLAADEAVAPTLERLLADAAVDFLHVHNAKHGCYVARVDRT